MKRCFLAVQTALVVNTYQLGKISHFVMMIQRIHKIHLRNWETCRATMTRISHLRRPLLRLHLSLLKEALMMMMTIRIVRTRRMIAGIRLQRQLRPLPSEARGIRNQDHLLNLLGSLRECGHRSLVLTTPMEIALQRRLNAMSRARRSGERWLAMTNRVARARKPHLMLRKGFPALARSHLRAQTLVSIWVRTKTAWRSYAGKGE